MTDLLDALLEEAVDFCFTHNLQCAFQTSVAFAHFYLAHMFRQMPPKTSHSASYGTRVVSLQVLQDIPTRIYRAIFQECFSLADGERDPPEFVCFGRRFQDMIILSISNRNESWTYQESMCMSNRAKPDLRWPWWSGRLSRGHLGIAYLRGHLPCFCHKNSITKAYKSHLESIKWYKALAPRVSKSLNIPESEIPNVGATAIHPDFWWLSAIFRWHIGVMEQGTVNPIRFRSRLPTNLAWP